MEIAPDTPLFGPAIARGTCRLLASHGFSCLTEMTLKTRLRADVMALGPKGEIWIVECKSSRADFQSDRKWQGYLEWCDRFFFAVPPGFPEEILPPEPGLIRADAWDGEVIRDAPLDALAGARRKAVTLKLARDGLRRWQALADAALPG
ncbi:MmcB family DNA repair protein [Paracoccaceae bacterium GXU_MW_L88]